VCLEAEPSLTIPSMISQHQGPTPRSRNDTAPPHIPSGVAQVIYALCLGGSEVLAWRLATALTKGGRFPCAVYGVHRSGPLADVLKAVGSHARAFQKDGRRGLDVGLIGRVALQLRRDAIRLVHTHHLGQLIYGGLAARLAGAKLVHTEHEFYTLRQARPRRLLRCLPKRQ
jgi:hypothetical protein